MRSEAEIRQALARVSGEEQDAACRPRGSLSPTYLYSLHATIETLLWALGVGDEHPHAALMDVTDERDGR